MFFQDIEYGKEKDVLTSLDRKNMNYQYKCEISSEEIKLKEVLFIY